MFGGDWPVCTRAATLRQWVEALKSIVRDRQVEQQEKRIHDNAVTFYGLKDTEEFGRAGVTRRPRRCLTKVSLRASLAIVEGRSCAAGTPSCSWQCR